MATNLGTFTSSKAASDKITKSVAASPKPTCAIISGYPKRTHPADSDNNYEIIVRWKCTSTFAHIDHFDVDVEVYNTRTGKWQQVGSGYTSVSPSSYVTEKVKETKVVTDPKTKKQKRVDVTKNGKPVYKTVKRFTCTVDPGNDVFFKQARVRIRAVSKTREVVAYYTVKKTVKKYDQKKKKYVNEVKTEKKSIKRTKAYFATPPMCAFSYVTLRKEATPVYEYDRLAREKPPKPAPPTAELTPDAKIKVSFDPTDQGTADTCRFIYRMANGRYAEGSPQYRIGDHRTPPTTTYYVDDGVIPGKEYRYYARAHNYRDIFKLDGNGNRELDKNKKAISLLSSGSRAETWKELRWSEAPDLPDDLCAPVATPPAWPKKLTVSGFGEDGAKVSFNYAGYIPAVTEARIYYAKTKDELRLNQTSCSNVEAHLNTNGNYSAIVTGLEPGTWYFTVWISTGDSELCQLFCNEAFDMGTIKNSMYAIASKDWKFKTCKIATTPEPPTMLSVPKAVFMGSALEVGWIHNDESESAQTAAELQVTATKPTGQTYSKTYKATTKESAIVAFDANFTDETVVVMKARTKGAGPNWSDWSDTVQLTVYAQPVCDLDFSGASMSTGGEGFIVTGLPLTLNLGVLAKQGTLTQDVVQWTVALRATSAFTYTDNFGNEATMPIGAVMYEGVIDSYDSEFTQPNMLIEVNAAQAVFVNAQSYEVELRALMDSGLEAEPCIESFFCDFEDSGMAPPSVTVEPYAGWSARLNPSVVSERDVPEGDDFVLDIDVMRLAETMLETPGAFDFRFWDAYGEEQDLHVEWNGIDDSFLIEGAGEWAELLGATFTPIEGEPRSLKGERHGDYYQNEAVTLTVYRVESDGSLYLVAENVPNAIGTVVQDRHPSFGDMIYRVLANDPETDEITCTDVIEPNDWNTILIQWNERDEFYVADYEDDTSDQDYPFEYVELPWDIETSESGSKDKALQALSGRTRPRVLYGTQVGETGSWSCNIVKFKEDWELRQLRKLKTYMGACWVRDPSGMNYRANVDVSINRSTKSAAISVKLEVTPVDDDKLV